MFNLRRTLTHSPPIRAWKRACKRRALTHQAVTVAFGGQDCMDLLSYAGLKEESSYVQINDRFVRTLFISGYPYVASTGWLQNLITFNHNIDISYHIEHIDPLTALPKLTRKITELESTKRTMLKEGRVIGSEITDPLESAMELKDKILRGMEKLFQLSIYMTISAENLLELHKMTKLLETVMQTKLFYIKPAVFQQIEGLQSILPRAENVLAQRRNLDSSSAALTFPFVSSELVQESGILYGINKSNNSLVIIDRYSLNNANAIVFAQSGSGKSYTAKVEILRHLMQGTKVIIIDPEREYKQLAKSVHGTYIKLSSTSKEKINPFQYTQSVTGENSLAEHIQDLTALISLMVGTLTSEERAVVDRALLQTYKRVGMTPRKHGNVSSRMPSPLLKDFYHELKTLKHADLCHRLERFVKGSLRSIFDAQTNIAMNNRLVVFDIKDLNESIRSMMMMVVANFVNNEVKQHPQKRMLVIDEGWMLLQEPESARFISGLVRRARKYYLGVTIISQQANDFLTQEYGKAIASQSSLRILMRQDTTTIKRVAEEFHLSAYEQHYLLTCDRGEALLIADQNHVAVTIVASEKEHPLLTTDPREIYI